MTHEARHIIGLMSVVTASMMTPVLAIENTAVEPVYYDYDVVNAYPHDPGAFTQGLFIDGGVLFESTGQFGQSSLREVALHSGDIIRHTALAPEFFGEGAVAWDDKIVTLTWRGGKGFIYNRKTLAKVAEFSYPGEGWGLTHDGSRLIMSDGTPRLRFLDPESLQETGALTVTFRGKPLPNLNELEWVEGEIFANVWTTDAIVRIDPDTGAVTGVIDLRGLLDTDDTKSGKAEVLNGIAYDATNRRLFVTGKYWPKLFEVSLRPRGAKTPD